jgi:hypothetical protein
MCVLLFIKKKIKRNYVIFTSSTITIFEIAAVFYPYHREQDGAQTNNATYSTQTHIHVNVVHASKFQHCESSWL